MMLGVIFFYERGLLKITIYVIAYRGAESLSHLWKI
jgi:hypothetical protein